MECEVWWAGVSFDQKPYRRMMMEIYGANAYRSPSELTESGRKALAEDPDSPGSIGIAVSEAVEVALSQPDTAYALGSAVNHVVLHQTVIGEEALLQFAKAGDYPDVRDQLRRRRLQPRRHRVPVPAREAHQRQGRADPGRRAHRLPGA